MIDQLNLLIKEVKFNENFELRWLNFIDDFNFLVVDFNK